MYKYFSLSILLILMTTSVASAKTKKYPVNDGEYRTVELSSGKTITCYATNPDKNPVPGKIKRIKGKQVFIATSKKDKKKIGKTKKAAASARGSLKNKLLKKLKRLRKSNKEKKTLCALGLDDPEQEPENLFEPLKGTPSSKQVRLLLERAAFGTSYREGYVFDAANSGGIEAAVNVLMEQRAENSGVLEEMEDWVDGRLDNTDERRAEFYGMRAGWLHLLVNTNNPFREKLGLFLWTIWAGNESSLSRDEAYYMWEYINLVRSHAYSGSLKELTRSASISPMVLRWLSNTNNVKDHINEEFASAFLHSFMLGTEGYKSGKFKDYDVRLVAEAFSGWQLVELEDAGGEDVLRPFFISNEHVSGSKQLFGGTPYSCAADIEEDVYNCLFGRNLGTAEHYSRSLLKFYLTDEPSENLVKGFAGVIRENDYALDKALAVLFKSKLFYEPQYINTAFKNPVEIAIEFIRTLNIPIRISDNYRGVRNQLDRMNMSLTSQGGRTSYGSDNYMTQNFFLSLSNFYASIIMQDSLFDELQWTPQQILPEGEVFAREVIIHVANQLGVELSENQIEQLRYYMNHKVIYESEIERELYDNVLESHQERKGLGLYLLLGLTPDFVLK